MAIEALGRVFNVVPTADAVEVNLRDVGAVTFVCVGADTYTVQESTDASGTSAQDLDVVDHYYTCTSAAGAAAWVRATQTADAAVTIGSGVAVIEVDSNSLSDGFDFIECTSSAAGLVVAITHDLSVQRAPQNLPAAAV